MAVRNFVQLCLEGYYDNTIFHRLVKDFLIQGGDPTGTGEGGESVYGEHFKDEHHSRLRFTHRGILACASFSKNQNASQFFITLDATPNLNKKHTIFGKVTGETVFNLLSVNSIACDKNDRPKMPPKVIRAELLLPPFDDIVPRVKEVVKETATIKEKPVAVKNTKLLSFAMDEEEDEDGGTVATPKFKMVSSYVVMPAKKKKKKEEEEAIDLTLPSGERKKREKKGRPEKKPTVPSLNNNDQEKQEQAMRKVQEETKALLAELKSKREQGKKRTREELMKEEGKALLAQRQERYLSNKKQKNLKDIESDLSSFLTNLRNQSKDEDKERKRKQEEEEEEKRARAEAKARFEKALEDDASLSDEDKEKDWKKHRLNFAKDENPIVDLNTLESYSYEDPLEIRKATEGDVMYNLHQRKLKAQKNTETW